MNPKRLVLAIIVVFIGIFVTDFLIHGLWLKENYEQTKHLWRSEAQMEKHFGWMFLGQFLIAVPFVILWAKGFAEKACIRCACVYGFLMALFAQAGMSFITYAVQPLPEVIPLKWFISGILQGVLLGVLVFFVYKPAPKPSEPAS
jgi:hypothetical protein